MCSKDFLACMAEFNYSAPWMAYSRVPIGWSAQLRASGIKPHLELYGKYLELLSQPISLHATPVQAFGNTARDVLFHLAVQRWQSAEISG